MSLPPRPAIVHRTPKFDSYYKALDKPIKETVDAVLAGIEKDCGNPWFEGRKMGGYTDKWLFTVNGQYRIVADKREGDEFELEMVGTKNQIKKKY